MDDEDVEMHMTFGAGEGEGEGVDDDEEGPINMVRHPSPCVAHAASPLTFDRMPTLTLKSLKRRIGERTKRERTRLNAELKRELPISTLTLEQWRMRV